MAKTNESGTADIAGSEIPEGSWSVAELNAEIKETLSANNTRFPRYIVGEISGINAYDFGTFFSLRDLSEEAVIPCIAWAYAVDRFDHALDEGAAVVVQASVDFYEKDGRCQLVVSDYWPIGESNRIQELEELRAQLADEGLFEEERKQEVAKYPKRIGLVTSPSGSAREDIWTAINSRSPRTRVTLCGATVQGENAVQSLITAVQHLEADPTIETIIITRGGGADTDLWCFNAEPLIRCVASCRTPVIVAIGHEDDSTLLELVADQRAMTPTDAGVQATTKDSDLKESLRALEWRISTAYNSHIEKWLEQLDRRIQSAQDSIKNESEKRDSLRQRLDDIETRISLGYRTLVTTRLDRYEGRIESLFIEVQHNAKATATERKAARNRLGDLEARIDGGYSRHIDRELELLESRINTSYRDVEATAKVKAGTAEARQLKVVVAILVSLILIGLIVLIVVLL